MSKRKWWVLAAISWMITIFFFTQLPNFTGKNTEEVIKKVVVKEQSTLKIPSTNPPEINQLNLTVRKSTHVIVFGFLAFLLFKTFETYRFSFILSWLLTVTYAITDEWHQSFMPGRVSTYRDVLFDSAGAFLVLLILIVTRSNQKRTQ